MRKSKRQKLAKEKRAVRNEQINQPERRIGVTLGNIALSLTNDNPVTALREVECLKEGEYPQYIRHLVTRRKNWPFKELKKIPIA